MPAQLSRARAITISAASIALAATGLAFASTATASTTSGTTSSARPAASFRRACALPTTRNTAACHAIVNLSAAQHATMTAAPDATAPTTDGFGPASLQAAYKLPSATAGTGQTVAVVDAFNDPNAKSDLATYRADFGQPACNTSTSAGCLTVVNQNGKTSPLPRSAGSSGWATEESLDIDMVSAICPNCRIILVEASSASIQNLGTGVNAAVSLGAHFVSNSYGGSESSSDATFDSEFYEHAGVAVTASAGDGGFGVSYPAASQFVTAVGGTSLKTASSARGWTESVWSTSRTEGTGAGCSADDAKPAWQKDTGCTRRTDNDVAAVADPATGVAVFDSFDQDGFLEVGGTSASSPIIAATFALAGTPSAGTFPSSDIYAHTSSLFDVTTGSLGTCSPAYLCTAETGYDGPTGFGTPDGTAAFTG
ncbi:MAG TPA: S53 family peptidase [Streptosporangiaceae bacterium]